MRRWRGLFAVPVVLATAFLLSCQRYPDSGGLTLPQLLNGNASFAVHYTSTTVESMQITAPARFGGRKTQSDASEARSVPGEFQLLIEPRREDGLRKVTLNKAQFTYPSIELMLDVAGKGQFQAVPSGDIKLVAERHNPPGSLADDGKIKFHWTAMVDFPALRDLKSEPMKANAETVGTFSLTDGILQETTTLSVVSGVLNGLVVLLIYSKPPPDIPCLFSVVADDCLTCARPGVGCRVNGTTGTCVQVSGGCACRTPGGVTLAIYRCG